MTPVNRVVEVNALTFAWVAVTAVAVKSATFMLVAVSVVTVSEPIDAPVEVRAPDRIDAAVKADAVNGPV
jgi:hypothetical protein